jgi:hypothetical protein
MEFTEEGLLYPPRITTILGAVFLYAPKQEGQVPPMLDFKVFTSFVRPKSFALPAILSVMVLVVFLAAGCADTQRSPSDPGNSLELLDEQDHDLGGVLYRSTIGFEVIAVADATGIVGVRYYAAKLLAAEESTLPAGEAINSFSPDTAVRVSRLVKFYKRVSARDFELYGTVYPQMDEFDFGVPNSGAKEDQCEFWPSCNTEPCNELTIRCLKECFEPQDPEG